MSGRGVYITYRLKDNVSDLRAIVVDMLFKMDITNTLSKATVTAINKYIMKGHATRHAKSLSTAHAISEGAPNLEDRMYNGLTAAEYVSDIETGTVFGKEVLRMKVDTLKRGELSLRVPYQDLFVGNFLTPCLHGGVAAAVADHCGGFCARSMLDDNVSRVSTVGLQIDYLAPVGCFEDMLCDATIVNARCDMIVVDVVCWNQTRTTRLVTCRAVFNVYTPKKSYS
jgi:acyl-coenzyme A thioesterase PaaI-like protein